MDVVRTVDRQYNLAALERLYSHRKDQNQLQHNAYTDILCRKYFVSTKKKEKGTILAGWEKKSYTSAA